MASERGSLSSLREGLRLGLREGWITKEEAEKRFRSVLDSQSCDSNERSRQPPPARSVASLLAEMLEYELFPYKMLQRRAQISREDTPSDPEEFKCAFESNVKCGRVTPAEVIVCAYLLYSDDLQAGSARLLQLIFTSELQRLQCYNRDILGTYSNSDQDTYGPLLEHFPTFLLPGKKHRLQNIMMLVRFRKVLEEGGGGDLRRLREIGSGVYKENPSASLRGAGGIHDFHMELDMPSTTAHPSQLGGEVVQNAQRRDLRPSRTATTTTTTAVAHFVGARGQGRGRGYV